jgi:hypothetical protein
MEIKLHKKQSDALSSEARNIFCISGIQGGKTILGAIWLNLQTATYTHPDDCFILAVPTYKTWSQATSVHFHKFFHELGDHNKADNDFTLYHNKRKIYIRSMDNVNSCEGITNCRAIWCDEAGMFKYQAWVNIQGRAAFREACIFGTTTPYTLNWLYHDIYKPWCDGKLSDTSIHQWRSIDNPYFPKAEYDRQKAMLDPRIFSMKYEGTFQKMAGLVYEDFDRAFNIIPPFDWRAQRSQYYVCAGIDWGYSNPFAIVVRALKLDGTEDFQLDEFMRSHLTPDECVEMGKQYKNTYGIECFYCDEEAPDYIAAFNIAGLKAVPVKKGAGSVKSGIGIHNALIKSRIHKLFAGKCKQTIDEYETYAYPQEGGENPIDANNHLMSATRYVTMATEWLRHKAKEQSKFVPYGNPTARLLSRHGKTKDWAYT